MHDAKRARDEITGHRGNQRRHERTVLDPTEHQELEAEDGAGQRRTEDRAEAARDPGCDQLPPRAPVDAQVPRQEVSEACAHLDGRTLAPGAAAEQVREHGAHEHHRRHAEGQLRRRRGWRR